MQILLLSMPDSFEHTPTIAVRMPNGALASLAANVDPHHRTAVADLVLAQSSVRNTVEGLVRDIRPDVVGLSVMTFQRSTARRIISLIKSMRPQVRVVVGGYDPSLRLTRGPTRTSCGDVRRRGGSARSGRCVARDREGRAVIERGGHLVSRRQRMHRNPPRGVASLDDEAIMPPKRSARVLSGTR